MAIKHVFSNAIADGTNTNIVRPSDWNSSHNLIYALSGNTAGSSQVSGLDVIFKGGNNITMSADTANSHLVISGADVSQYLTTAAQSNHSHGNPTLSLAGGLSGATASNSAGFTLSLTQAAAAAAPFNFSAGTTSNLLSAVTFDNSNGVSFGLSGSVITGSVNNAGTGATLGTRAGINMAATLNTDGLSLEYPNIITTAMLSNAATISNIKISGGTTSNLLSALTFADSNGVSFGLNAGTLTATVATNYQSQGAYLTTAAQSSASNVSGVIAGTASNAATNQSAQLSGAISFSNGSGVSFFTTASGAVSGIAATVKTDYLTTAMASNRGSDFVQANATFAGTNASGTIASNGISVSVGNYITTAMLSNAATISNIRVSGGTTSNLLSAITFANSNGVSFGLNAGTLTATVATNYQSAGAYLTTAMQSNAATISNINFSAGTTSQNLSKLTFADSNGVSFGLNGSVVTATVKTDYQSAGAYLTTAMQSNAATISNINFSAGTTSQNLSKLTFADSNGVSFGLNGSVVTATVATNYQSAGAYLTTAALSGDTSKYIQNWKLTGNAAGTTSSAQGTDLWLAGGNGVTISGSSNTLSISVATNYQSQGAYLTTAALSNHSHGDPTLNLTNLSGTTASNSAGFTLSLSAAAPAGGIGIAAGTRTATTAGSLLFDNANGITFGLNAVAGSIMTASHNGLTTAALSDHSHGNPTLALTNLTGTTASASNGFTLSLSAAKPVMDYYVNAVPFLNSQTMTVGGSTSHIIPFFVQENLSFDFMRMIASGSIASASIALGTTSNVSASGGYTKSHNFVLYSRGTGGSTGSLQSYYSTQIVEYMSAEASVGANTSQYSYTYQYTLPCSTGTVGFTHNYSESTNSIRLQSSQVTGLTGMKHLDFPVGTTLSPGVWWAAYGQSSSTQTSVMQQLTRNYITYNFLGMSQATIQIGSLGGDTQQTCGVNFGNGSFSTNGAAGTTASMGFSNITTNASNNMMYFQLMRTQ